MTNNFYGKCRRLRDNVENSSRAGQAKDGNMAHTRYMLNNQGYSSEVCHPRCVLKD